MEIDRLVEVAVVNSMAETGTPIRWLEKQSRIKPFARRVHDLRPERWSQEELILLEQLLPYKTYSEISAIMGRSKNALHVAQVRKRVPAPSKRIGWLTGRMVADTLGSDIHAICAMNSRGILKMETLPGPRHILRMRKISLYVWACDPMHWPYFRQNHVTDPHLKRLIELRKERWADEWWSIGRVAKYFHTGSNTISKRIRDGKLEAVDWGNYWIRSSVAMKLKIITGKGHGVKRNWSPGADAYILQARAEGDSYAVIAKRMKLNGKTIEYRYRVYLKGKVNLA